MSNTKQGNDRRSTPMLEEISLFLAVATGATTAAFAIPLWLNSRFFAEWAKLVFIGCAIGACVSPLAVRSRPGNVWALYASVALTAICMASFTFHLYIYVPALVSMLVAAELASHAARREENGH